MSITKIMAIFKKQVKDTIKNKEVLIQFVMFPSLAFVMTSAMKIPGMDENFFVIMFATMYIGMAPLTSMAAILSEEKGDNTLRVLMMSNVKASEYLTGAGGYILIICLIGSVAFGAIGKFQGKTLLMFLIIMLSGIITSSLIGAAIGIYCKNQMSATSVTVPVMMIFSFLPMISMFNERIGKISRLTYSQQIQNLLNQMGDFTVKWENTVVILANMAIAAGLFIFAYKKRGLAD